MTTSRYRYFASHLIVGLSIALSGCQSGGSAASDASDELGKCPKCEMRMVERPRRFGDPKPVARHREIRCADCQMGRTEGSKYDPAKLCVCCGGTLTACAEGK